MKWVAFCNIGRDTERTDSNQLMLIISRDWISLFKEPYLTKPKAVHEGEVRTCGQSRCYEMGRPWHENVLRVFRSKKKQTNISIAKHAMVLCKTVSEFWARYFFTGIRWFSFRLGANYVIYARATKFLGGILLGTRRIRLFMWLILMWPETMFIKIKVVSLALIKKLRISTDEGWSCLV